MSNDYSNWCPEIYRGLFVDRFNDDHIRIAPCCQARVETEPVEAFKFDTSPYLNKLREKFNQGKKPKACNACWKAEEYGHKSRRQNAIEFYNIQPSQEIILESVDHSATWACNLACVICSPHISSAWATELNFSSDKLYQLGRRFQKSNDIINQLDFANIRKVHFNGGEPLLNNDHVKVLEKLDNLGVLSETRISYNTNATIEPSKQAIEFWSRAKTVVLFFSIDATEEAFEYIRYPAKWKQAAELMIKLKNTLPKNIMFSINMTVGCYNIFETINVLNWYKANLYSEDSTFCWQFENSANLGHLPREAKLDALNKLNTTPELSGLVNALNSGLDTPNTTSWTNKLDIIDQRRNTSWRKVLEVGKYY